MGVSMKLYRLIWFPGEGMWVITDHEWKRLDKCRHLATVVLRIASLNDGEFRVWVHPDSLNAMTEQDTPADGSQVDLHRRVWPERVPARKKVPTQDSRCGDAPVE